MKELDSVVLMQDLIEYRLKAGDIGAIVHTYSDEKTFEVEFVRADGRTVAVLTLTINEIRPIEGNEILHVRELETAQAREAR